MLMMSFWVMLVIWLQKGIGADAGKSSHVGSGWDSKGDKETRSWPILEEPFPLGEFQEASFTRSLMDSVPRTGLGTRVLT